MTEINDLDHDKIVKAFKSRRFDPVIFVETAEEATKTVLEMIPADAKVGMGGSTSLMQLGIVEELVKRGSLTFSKPEIFLTSSNAITLDGKLVNTDMTGNRVSSMIFGPKQVIIVVGVNKIVKDVNAALDRLKNVINPYLAKNAGLKNPCSVDGKCHDCKSPTRVCSVTTIIEAKPRLTQISIVLVGEDLGLGWDPEWEEERKERIAEIFREKWSQMAMAAARRARQ